MARKLTGILDQDTVMMPWIMADTIVGEAAVFVRQMREDNGDLLDRMADELATKQCGFTLHLIARNMIAGHAISVASMGERHC